MLLSIQQLFRNYDWIKFIIEEVGVDLSQSPFNQLLHFFLSQSGQKEKYNYQNGIDNTANTEKDIQILELFLKSKHIEGLLKEKDESYGNTPLHIACSLHSFVFIKRLLEADKNILLEKNSENKTPKEILEDEFLKYKGYVECPEKQRSLERLALIKEFLN